MRTLVTILSSSLTLAALFRSAARRAAARPAPGPRPRPASRGGAESKSTEAKVLAWQRELPAIFKYEFERSADHAVMAIPVCVKDADTAELRDYVVTSGLVLPTSTITLAYDYMFTPRRNRSMRLEVTRHGTSWRGLQFEDSLLHTLTGLREVTLDLPTCSAADVNEPGEIRFVASDGRKTKVSTLVDASGTLSCH